MTIKELESCHNENTSLIDQLKRPILSYVLYFFRSHSGTLHFKHSRESSILSFHYLTFEFVCVARMIQCVAFNTRIFTNFAMFFCTETVLKFHGIEFWRSKDYTLVHKRI